MEPDEIRFTSGKEECVGWLCRPPAGGNERAPCVVLGMGLSGVYDQGLARYGELFARAGFAALAFDYRYFGRGGGEPRSLVLFGRQRADWRAAVACARGLAGPPGSLSVLSRPRLAARLRGDYPARIGLAQRALRPRGAGAALPVGAQGAPAGELRLYPGGHFDLMLGETSSGSALTRSSSSRANWRRRASRRSSRPACRASPRPGRT